MSMEPIHSLSQLLDQAQCHYSIFDLSRRVQHLDTDIFKAVEDNRQPYPWPLQQHAHFALAFWQETDAPWIWFLRFPLDERGLLKAAAVGDFIKYTLEALGSRVLQDMTEEQQHALSQNPYIFKPKEDKLAVFHAQLSAQLKLPASHYYASAQDYLNGKLGWDQWQQLGLQGIADVCVRSKEKNNATAIRKALQNMPITPCYALLGCLEHQRVNDSVYQIISEKLTTELSHKTPDIFLMSAYLRALSGQDATSLATRIQQVLNHPEMCHAEVLIAIAGRCWNALTQPNIATQFLIRLAETKDQTLFNQLFADLVTIPALRGTLLPLLHSNQNPQLTQAILTLQNHTRQSTQSTANG